MNELTAEELKYLIELIETNKDVSYSSSSDTVSFKQFKQHVLLKKLTLMRRSQESTATIATIELYHDNPDIKGG